MIVLNEAKVKYDLLNVLFKEKLEDIQYGQNVNIILDLKEVIRKLFRPEIISLSEDSSLLVEELTSDIISIISHYRNYFYKHGKYTTFYYIYSEKECQNILKIFPEYKKEYYEKYFNSSEDTEKIKLIKKVVSACKKIIDIIPNAFYIESSVYDEITFTKAILEKTKTNELNIICSNDSLMMQCLNKHTFILNLKGIKSQLIDQSNAISILTKKETTLSSNLASLIFSIAGDKKSNYPNIPGFALAKTLSLLELLVKSEVIADVPSLAFPIEFAKLEPHNKLHQQLINKREQIINSYNIVSGTKFLYENRIEISGLLNIPKRKVSRFHFLQLNAKIFTRFPLMLDMLLRGEL